MSSPSDRVLGTPPTNTSARSPADSTHALETGLAIQQRERETALQEVARLRKEASAEIKRLLAFLDASDPYAATELEENGDEADAAYPEGGRQYGPLSPNEDDEDTGDAEPSLGSSGHGQAGSISYAVRPISDGFQMVYDCEEEHDGTEPDDACNEASAGFDTGEPSLGWTVDGCVTGGTGQGRWDVQDDLEVSL